MDKDQRSNLIKSLVADKHSGFTTGDEKMLEVATDERLEAIRTAAAARTKEETDKAAHEKELQDKLKAAEAKAETRQLTEEELMKAAPEELRTLLARAKAQEAARKTTIVADLKAAQAEYTETELTAMSLDALERLARAVKVDVPEPTSYAGRGVPRAAAAGDKDVYANPPDPYADGLKALRAAAGGGNSITGTVQ